MIARALLRAAEDAAPADVSGFEIASGAGSAAALRFYRRSGYRKQGQFAPGVVRLVKDR
jgi:hypothetical protein